MNLAPFRLYGLSGCGHCQQAEAFMRKNQLPCELIVANNDPVVAAGVKAITSSDNYPVLISRPTSEVIIGFKPEDYERILKVFTDLASAGTFGAFSGGQQVSYQTSGQAAEVSTGAK